MIEAKKVAMQRETKDQIVGNHIILHYDGEFPKQLIIIQNGTANKEYTLRKTKQGKFQLI